tara:strand:+ start:53 stop:835 length:783 start_codon:yes stop_codon:yes gene_type:complete
LIKLKSLLVEGKKPTLKLKSGSELELSILLQKKFIEQISSVVGRDFEDVIVKYFTGGFKQTNVGNVESAFSDVRQGNTYYSVKYSKAVANSTLAKVTGDNFRLTTIGNLISRAVLASEGKYTNELKQIKNKKELEDFMKDKKISSNSFGIIAGYAFKKGDAIILKVQYSNILTGKELYKKLLTFYDSFKNINKQMRSHTVTKIFGHPGTEEFVLPAGDSIIANMKDKVEELILDKIYTTPEDLLLNIKKLPSILGKYLKV